MKFKKALVKTPGKTLSEGITSANLGKPDYAGALQQHETYIKTLIACGLEVSILEAEPAYPDSTFIEDTAVLTTKCAIITNPGASSRENEVIAVQKWLEPYFDNLEFITAPGTLDGGDVMMVGTHFFIGLSERTNPEGASQLIRILNRYNMSGETLSISNLLHLKSGVNYLESNNLLMVDGFEDHKAFQTYSKILVPGEESYAANSLWINGRVIVPKGFPLTASAIRNANYEVIEIDVSEFQKLDGGLSCLSLRF